MPNRIKPERVGEIPPDANVCHYDQLDNPVKHRFAEAVESASTGREENSSATALEDTDCDIVKFTEYYRLGGL